MKNKFFLIPFIFLFFVIFFTNDSFCKTTFDDNMIYPSGVEKNYTTSDSGLSCVNKVLYNVNDTYYMLMFFSNGVTHDTQKLYCMKNFDKDNTIFCTYSGKLLIVLHKYNSANKSWSYVNYWDTGLGDFYYSDSVHSIFKILTNGKVVSSSSDIYTSSSFKDIYFKATMNIYNIEFSTTDNTYPPLIAYSNYFDYADAKKYQCYISTDASNWTLMNYETLKDTNTGITKFRFNYKIYENGNYYFKFLNTENNEDYYISRKITNILKDSSNSGFTSSGIPQPFVTYERVNNEFILKTQSFTSDDFQKLQAFYIKDNLGNDFSSWNEMNIGSMKNTTTGVTEYYFYFTVPADSEDCTFYFVFYDYNLNEYGSPSSLKCVFDKMNEYANSISPVESEKNSKFNDLLKYFKDRFGFLTYPFEFIINFLNRILTINYSDPVIHIPELHEPVNNNKIFNGLDFNFNSLLNNNTFSYLYNIYLIAVDFIIIIVFIFLCKKVILEVFGNG